MDKLEPAILSFIERLSSLRRLKCTSIIEKGPQSASFIERRLFYCVFYLGVSKRERAHMNGRLDSTVKHLSFGAIESGLLNPRSVSVQVYPVHVAIVQVQGERLRTMNVSTDYHLSCSPTWNRDATEWGNGCLK